MNQDHHVIEVLHAANGFSPVAVYAHCTCGWEGKRRPLTQVTAQDGQDITVIVAEHEGMKHIEQRYSLGF